MKPFRKELSEGPYAICYEFLPVGRDLAVLITGGEAHIGAVTTASPLTDNVFSADLPMHKDIALTESFSVLLSRLTGKTVTCIGGVHYDGLSREGIQAILRIQKRAEEQAEEWMKAAE